MRVAFEVEQAGCTSCGELIRAALGNVSTVESVEVDETADVAAILLSNAPASDVVEAALVTASAGAGHVYRIRTGSWREI